VEPGAVLQRAGAGHRGLLAAGLVIALQSVVDAVRGFSHDLPGLIENARQSDLGAFVNGGSNSLDFLQQHAGDITSGLGKVSGGAARVGVSAFGAVTVVFSVTFLILFGLIDEPRVRASIGSMLYRDKRERYERLADRIIQTTSSYMLGNVAISCDLRDGHERSSGRRRGHGSAATCLGAVRSHRGFESRPLHLIWPTGTPAQPRRR
jgi:hypothetical protein